MIDLLETVHSSGCPTCVFCKQYFIYIGPLKDVQFQGRQKIASCQKYRTKQFLRVFTNRMIIDTSLFRHPLHAVFISKSCLDAAQCIISCT